MCPETTVSCTFLLEMVNEIMKTRNYYKNDKNLCWVPGIVLFISVMVYKTLLFRSPITIGGIFAISRKFFIKMGSYDDKMERWGGENLELSIKVIWAHIYLSQLYFMVIMSTIF